jgi:hypothetical protein
MQLPDPKTMNFAQVVEMLGRVDLDIATLSEFQKALRAQAAALSQLEALRAQQPATVAPGLIEQAAPVSNDEINWAALEQR